MGGFYFGPPWMWDLMIALAAIGAVSAVVGTVWLVAQLLMHVRWI